MHEEWEIERSYQVIRGKNRPKITWSKGLEREKWVWEVKSLKSVERDQGSKIWNRYSSLYRNLINLDRSRAVKQLSKFKTRVPAIEPVIKDLMRGFQHREVQWIEVAIEETRLIELAIKSYSECDKKKLKGLDWWLLCQELSKSYRDCLKTIFQRREKKQIWMQSSMQLNQTSKQHFKLSKTSLNMKNVKHKNPKTHTHKKQV